MPIAVIGANHRTAPIEVRERFAMGRNESLMIAQNLKKNTEYTETVLIGLLTDDDNASGFDRTLFNETFRKPFDAALLAERIRTLVGRKKQLA